MSACTATAPICLTAEPCGDVMVMTIARVSDDARRNECRRDRADMFWHLYASNGSTIEMGATYAKNERAVP